jgi:hypothetical protein
MNAQNPNDERKAREMSKIHLLTLAATPGVEWV